MFWVPQRHCFGVRPNQCDQIDQQRITIPIGAETMTNPSDKCYAYRDQDGTIDLDSIAESVQRVRDKMLVASMGWRYDYQDGHDAQWEMLLQYGDVVEVVILIVPE